MFDDPTPGKENLCGSFSTTNRFNKGKEVLQTATVPEPMLPQIWPLFPSLLPGLPWPLTVNSVPTRDIYLVWKAPSSQISPSTSGNIIRNSLADSGHPEVYPPWTQAQLDWSKGDVSFQLHVHQAGATWELSSLQRLEGNLTGGGDVLANLECFTEFASIHSTLTDVMYKT